MTYMHAAMPPQIHITEAVEICNPNGTFPALLVCDHASPTLPPEVGDLRLDPAHLRDHIGVDIGIAPVVRALSMLLDAPAVLTRHSRLMIDCNRWIKDPTSIPEESDGVPIAGNVGLDFDARAERWHRYFWPYHRTVHRMTTELRARHSAPLFVALHSCNRQFGDEHRDIDAGTFWNYDRRLSDALLTGLGREKDLKLACNSPYSGFRGTSFTLDYHTWGSDLRACGVEIVNDLITTPGSQAKWSARLADVLADIAQG
ncbi:N-formylglutamate amidohydrolase [Litoreibacter albidus]|uniref:Predicted N-formylglutamate amidohydrolase n=1 Tax=Litoreibacter albidus TaxID=670155 RepID=A0A1H3CRG9_9RHOB|nr:N-formylglutamate amidohydrolase [Litoreibacter albidus]SDX56725.1 Predicted N-formylglutamate amidohydrolase [Litoreibacter albidus]